MSKAQKPLAYLVTNGLTFSDRAFTHMWHAEASVAERKDGAIIIPLYAAPASIEQQAAQQDELTQAARDVLAERARQISVEGWTTAHDDLYRSNELACAAACYALGTKELTKGQGEVWPFEDLWWNPSDRRRNLIKASALLLAELERVDRAAARASNGGKA